QASLELLKTIFQDYPLLNVLIYTSEYGYLKPLAKAIGRHQGGFAIVSKLERRKSYIDGARHALDGKLEIPRELRHDIDFDDRDLQVLSFLCRDYLTDKAIAQRMNVSLKTAQNSVQRLKAKLGIDYLDENNTSTRVALCIEAIRRKIIVL
ncbi:MAG: response regulator transcription factor, partial [Pseudanabaena sp. RU_4_16]|nr:response regulator transcription factor [Pseudanabaena sp. RU_4_16]